MLLNNNRIFLIIILLINFQLSSLAQHAAKIKPDGTERKIANILKQLTLEEKISMCSGANPEMAFRGVKRLNIPNLKCSDGPRGPNRDGAATAFPTGITFGASWNPELVEQAGKVMGNESRAKNIYVLLGPGNNILRDPLNGRFFEYYTEDPFLNAAISVAQVKGIQSEGVAACLKHYACNNREDNRNFYMSMVDDRTLNEIYLPAYKAAVQKGKVWTIMTSANGVNNEFVSDSKKMLTDILKNEWGFDGFTMTDWLQTRSTEKAALAGLDVSMPGGKDCGFGTALLDAVKAGRVPESVIDDKVRRILRIYARVGALDDRDIKAGAKLNTPQHQLIALKASEEGIVLLKNKGNILPLDSNKIRNLVVIGPNADKKLCVPGAGGSSGIMPPFEITPLQGLKNILGNSRVHYISSEDLGGFQLIPEYAIISEDGKPGFNSAYFAKDQTNAVVKRSDPTLDFMWEMKSPDPKIDPKEFTHATFEGKIIPPMDGKYAIRVIVEGIATVYHGIKNRTQIAFADRNQTLHIAYASVDLKKDVPYEISIDYTKEAGDAGIRLEWELPEVPAQKWAEVDKVVKAADAVVFIGGIDHSMDTEGRDRKDLIFPGAQENLLNRLSKTNKNLVAILINGSPLELGGWLPNVPAVLEAWYPGMEGGKAISNVLFGKVSPSGKLPFSWPKKLSLSPSQVLGTENNEVVNYTDSLMVGYRYYDIKKLEPEFPFGFGLSYTTFSFKSLKVTRAGKQVIGSIQINNNGRFDGAEVMQVYVKPLKPSVFRPAHELKAFKKVHILTGKSQKVSFQLGPDAFSYYSVKKGKWVVDPGKYEVQVGASSRDIRATAYVTIPN
ncbi:MAG: glycoside hydrolase family 3 C-terminal domain-containing protein [Bacteroidota bacterium]|nr:glycoside hydrolase family 3 C-terminal domain-containing protein [Bacteroidota bacterium]